MATGKYLFEEEEELSDFSISLTDFEEEGEDLDLENEGESITTKKKRAGNI